MLSLLRRHARIAGLLLTLALVPTLLWAVAADSTAAGAGGVSLVAVIANVVVGALAAGLTALVKYGVLSVVDAPVAALLKKFQPFVTLVLAALLPALWHLLPANGVPVPDVTQVVNAPVATILGVVIAELVALVRGKYPLPDAAGKTT
jgi:hypothetical protein